MTRFWLIISLALPACRAPGEPHDHGSAHPPGHDHHEEGHGHNGKPVVSYIRWSDQFELFAEHQAALVGQTTKMLLHLTVLDGFGALTAGQLHLELQGPVAISGTANAPIRPGIYSIAITAPKPGLYRGSLRVSGEVSGVIKGIELEVFADAKTAKARIPEDDGDHGVIEFLKEQQWNVPFGTAFAQTSQLISAVEVSGVVDTPPGGRAEVSAPVTGRLVAPAGGLLSPGAQVTAGQVLASLVPAPSSPESAARIGLIVAEAEARVSAAQAAEQRAERLIKSEAISTRELEDARREAQVATESLKAARRAAALYSRQSGAGGQGSWRLAAPINGTLTAVDATPGATVAPGQTLFQIVNLSELWIVARIPEQDAATLRVDKNGAYQLAGLNKWQSLIVSGVGSETAANARVVTVSRTVDPISRTVDAIYSLKQPPESMRVGGLVRVNLPAGDDFAGVVIPRSALVSLDGRDVVYVQVDGEHFEERAVRVGPRSGGNVGIAVGLSAGERIVNVGAHLVRLAERASGPQPHGHIH